MEPGLYAVIALDDGTGAMVKIPDNAVREPGRQYITVSYNPGLEIEPVTAV